MACASRSHSIRFSSAAFAMAGLRVGLVKCSNRATGSMFRARRQVDAPDRMVDDRIAAPQHSLAGGDGGGGPMRENGLVERTGRRALVTGGSRGLGLEIGRGFARAGYRVALTGRDTAALESAQADLAAEGFPIEIVVGDLCDGVPGIVGAAVDRLDGLDVLVHAAARSEEHTSELQSLMRISYAVFCLKKKTTT